MTPVSPREGPGVSQGNVVQNPKMLRDWPEALKIHATGTPPRWRLKGWERQWRGAAARGLPAAWTLRRGPRARLPGGRPAGRRLFRAVGSGAFGGAPPAPGPALGRLACRGEGETLTTARCTQSRCPRQARRASLGNQTSSQVRAQETEEHGSVPSAVPRARGFGEQVPLRHVHDPGSEGAERVVTWERGGAGPRSPQRPRTVLDGEART